MAAILIFYRSEYALENQAVRGIPDKLTVISRMKKRQFEAINLEGYIPAIYISGVGYDYQEFDTVLQFFCSKYGLEKPIPTRRHDTLFPQNEGLTAVMELSGEPVKFEISSEYFTIEFKSDTIRDQVLGHLAKIGSIKK